MKQAAETFRENEGINRYIVECKCYTRKEKKTRKAELIDTQWNVNYLDNLYKTIKDVELIDTQWNVNILSAKAS